MGNNIEDYYTDIKDYCQSMALQDLPIEDYCDLLKALQTCAKHCEDTYLTQKENVALEATREAKERILGRPVMERWFPSPESNGK